MILQYLICNLLIDKFKIESDDHQNTNTGMYWLNNKVLSLSRQVYKFTKINLKTLLNK